MFYLTCSSLINAQLKFQVADDMVNGALNMLQKMWNLVGTVANHLENETSYEGNDEKSRKLNDDMYKIRNSQLSMVKFPKYKKKKNNSS